MSIAPTVHRAAILPSALLPLARRLTDMLRGEATRYVAVEQLPDIRLEAVVFTQVPDPSNGLAGYEGVWRNDHNVRVGRLVFNSDGSYYAEYDLCVRHPRWPELFVEAVTAWGRDGEIKAEAAPAALSVNMKGLHDAGMSLDHICRWSANKGAEPRCVFRGCTR